MVYSIWIHITLIWIHIVLIWIHIAHIRFHIVLIWFGIVFISRELLQRACRHYYLPARYQLMPLLSVLSNIAHEGRPILGLYLFILFLSTQSSRSWSSQSWSALRATWSWTWWAPRICTQLQYWSVAWINVNEKTVGVDIWMTGHGLEVFRSRDGEIKLKLRGTRHLIQYAYQSISRLSTAERR